jgi:hypothetical protein
LKQKLMIAEVVRSGTSQNVPVTVPVMRLEQPGRRW